MTKLKIIILVICLNHVLSKRKLYFLIILRFFLFLIIIWNIKDAEKSELKHGQNILNKTHGTCAEFLKINALDSCCNNREDECFMYHYDTKCYCDNFCKIDCCSDSETICINRLKKLQNTIDLNNLTYSITKLTTVFGKIYSYFIFFCFSGLLAWNQVLNYEYIYVNKTKVFYLFRKKFGLIYWSTEI